MRPKHAIHVWQRIDSLTGLITRGAIQTWYCSRAHCCSPARRGLELIALGHRLADIPRGADGAGDSPSNREPGVSWSPDRWTALVWPGRGRADAFAQARHDQALIPSRRKRWCGGRCWRAGNYRIATVRVPPSSPSASARCAPATRATVEASSTPARPPGADLQRSRNPWPVWSRPQNAAHPAISTTFAGAQAMPTSPSQC